MDPYIPEALPLACLDHRRLIGPVGRANAALARYDGLLQALVNPEILLSPLTNQEAVLSSKIEGTQATLEEVLEHEAGQEYDQNKTDDIQEVLNYRTAMRMAKAELQDRPVRLGMILQLHRVLMNSVRGQDKTPGQFRTDQNWFGRPGCNIEEATFVPPAPLQLNDHLEAWQQYVQGNDFDSLVQASIAHAQFELIHPFKDGNGRIGRLIIPLLMFSKGSLSSPMFYLSEYLEEHRDEYYDRLKAISAEQNWNAWVEFFLRAIEHQASRNLKRAQAIRQLYDAMKAELREVVRSQHGIQLLDSLFDRPIFRVANLISLNIPQPTAHLLVRKLLESRHIITLRAGSGRRPAVYAFPRLLDLAETGR